MKSIRKFFPLLLVLALVQAACNFPASVITGGSPTPVPLVTFTSAAPLPEPTATNTLPPVVTATSPAQPTATQAAPASQPTPTATTAAAAPTATRASVTGGVNCTLAASFVADVTIPDDSTIAAGQSFVKTWRVRNDGTCPWGPTHAVRALAFVSGTKMGAPDQVALTGEVEPGKSVDLSVTFTAPTTNGVYTSEWKLRLDNGQYLGLGANKAGALYVRIRVGSAASSSTTRIQFASGATAAAVSGDLKANESKGYVLTAMRDQVLIAAVTSADSSVKVKITAADGRTLANPNASSAVVALPSNQDYTVWVMAGDKAASFNLNITIPSRIQFDRGAVSDTVSGKISGRGTVSYVLWAAAGQTMTVKVSADHLALHIYGLKDGQVLVKADSGAKEWSGKLPASQDYIVAVVPSVDSASFTLEVTIK